MGTQLHYSLLSELYTLFCPPLKSQSTKPVSCFSLRVFEGANSFPGTGNAPSCTIDKKTHYRNAEKRRKRGEERREKMAIKTQQLRHKNDFYLGVMVDF